MNQAFLFYAKRTPIGKFAGALAPMRVDDMMATLLKDFTKHNSFDMQEIDDVYIGNANQAGEDNRNLARMSLLLAGLPFEVPGVTLNRLCGSSLDAIGMAWSQIRSGMADCLLVGGAESMSRAPYAISKAPSPYDRSAKMWDTSIGWRFPNPKMKEMFPLYSMGETAEEVAKLHNISREDQDKFALGSHQKALHAQASGWFKDEILPIEVSMRKKSYTVDIDESPRKETSLEKLSSLKAAFTKDGSVTAGNSSSINDGASLVGVASEAFIKKHKLTPLARITGYGVRGCHPNTMGLGPIFATKRLCEKFAFNLQDFDLIELNEAFAAQSLACLRELELEPDKTNLAGGAIALGHPLGSSGARIATTLVHHMKRDKKLKQGLATMCIGVGQGVAVSFESQF